jgi:antitoxin VapB
MALRVNNPEADSLAKELASYTGETLAQAVITALRERLEREKRRNQSSLAERLVQIGRECAALPVLDERMPDEILGYDDNGLPA